MKHCILMSVYKDIDAINNFIKYTPSDWGIFIHIDKKSKISPSMIDERAYCIKKYKIYWGSFLHVTSFLELMQLAVEKGNYDFFHLVTGQDFYCVNPLKFDSMLSPEKIYMMTKPFPVPDWTFWEDGYAMFKYITLARFFDVRPKYNKIAGLINILLKNIQKFRNKEKYLPRNFNLGGGLLYSSFPRYAVEYILDSGKTKLLEKRLKYSLCGEEVFFQTLFLSSPFKENIINDNMRYMNWNCKPAPKILDENDFLQIRESNALFCRKIDSKISEKLVKQIEKKLLL